MTNCINGDREILTVTIPKKEYDDLLETYIEHKILLDAFYMRAELGYNKDSLRAKKIEDVFEVLDPNRYGLKVQILNHQEGGEE